MLEFIRNRAQTWIAWVIVALIIIPFALWGIGDYFSGNADNSVATVNDVKISEREFQTAYYQQEQRMKEMLGEGFDSSLFETQIRKNVLDGLIEQELLVQVSADSGLRVSAGQLAMIIQGIQAFQNDGVFDRSTYESALEMQGQSTGYFESKVRRSILSQQLYSGVADSSIVTEHSVNALLRLQKQKREIAYFEIPSARFIPDVEIAEGQITDFYSNNSAMYKTPEIVSVEYIELSATQLGNEVEITDSALRDAYEEQKDSMIAPEQRRASHILVEIPYEASTEEREAAEIKAKDVLSRLNGGESFEELAKLHSDDPGSAEAGGSLGLFSAGDMVAEFDAKVFSMSVGEISGLVSTEFGYHIIRLDEISESQVPSFEEAREELLAQLEYNEAERLYYDMADRIASLSFEYPDSLDVVAEELQLTVQTVHGVARTGGPDFFANPKVTRSLFATDVLDERLNSEPIDIGDNHIVVVRVSEHIPAKIKPIEEVRDSIIHQLTEKESQLKAQQLGETVLAAIVSGGSLEEQAKTYEIDLHTPGLLERGSAELNADIIQRAFELPRPEKDGIAAGSVALGNGGYAVVTVASVEEFDLSGVDEAQRQATRRQLAGVQGGVEYSAFSSSLKDAASVVSRLEE